MDIIVCLKQVVDPEVPAGQFAIDPATHREVREGRPLVISTYDENALEVALQLKDRAGGKVTVLALGPQAPLTDAVRLALAMGADEAVVVDDARGPDRPGVERAGILAAAIRRIGRFDLVLSGCESADWTDRVVAPLVAEALGAACVTFVCSVEGGEGAVLARRAADDGFHRVEARLPAVLSITNDESNRPRFPKLKDIVAAKRKPVQVWPVADIPAAPGGPDAAGVVVREVVVPQRASRCEFIEGEPEAQAAALAQRLRDLKLL